MERGERQSDAGRRGDEPRSQASHRAGAARHHAASARDHGRAGGRPGAARQDRAADRRPDGGRGLLDLPEAPGRLARAVRHRGPQPRRRAQHPHEARRGPRRPLRRAGRAGQRAGRAATIRRSPTGRRRARRSITRCWRCRSCAAARCSACWSCRTARPRSTPRRTSRSCETTAMVVAEHVVSGAVAGAGAALDAEPQLADGGAGRADLGRHRARPRRAARAARGRHQADGRRHPTPRSARLEAAVDDAAHLARRHAGHEKLATAPASTARCSKPTACSPTTSGWLRRMRDAVKEGLTAEAAVERVQNGTRARMLRQNDPYWRERQRDLDDLSDRLLRILAGRRKCGARAHSSCRPTRSWSRAPWARPSCSTTTARKLRGLVIEDGSGQSHVAIVAKALGIAADRPGRRHRRARQRPAMRRSSTPRSGEVHLRPLGRGRRRLFRQGAVPGAAAAASIAALRDAPAGHQGRRAHRAQHQRRPAGRHAASGRVGRRRRRAVPHRAAVHAVRDAAAARAADASLSRSPRARPAASRSCSARSTSAATRCCPICASQGEENPALGWRAIRMSLDRPALFRTQVRALLRAAGGGELRIMIPMVSTAGRDRRRARADRARSRRLRARRRLARRRERARRRHARGAEPAVRARCADARGSISSRSAATT